MNSKLKLPMLIFFIFLSAVIAKADDMSWHKPTPCFGCHGETLDAGVGSGECGNCHEEYKLPQGGFNVPSLEANHNPKICKTCHIGNTIVDASDKELFHNGHNAVRCTVCHTENNFSVIKIQSNGFECVSCHGKQIHSIHIKNLTKICSTCHGSWANDKIYTGDNSSKSSNIELNSKLERFTIFSFIKNILDAVLGVNK